MYIRKVKKPDGRIYLSIVEAFYDKQKGQSRATTIKSLGYLDELEKEYDDPIAYFTEEVNRLNEQKKKDKLSLIVECDRLEKLVLNEQNRKNIGYAPASKIYHELEINKFLINRQRSSKEAYDANAIMKLLCFSRLLYPASKKSTFENKNWFFENAKFSLDDVYRSLSFFHRHKDALLLWIHERVKQSYNRNTELVYYDVTNYYFEIDEQDELRKKGVSKEHRPDPIVQMGLFVDTDGLPISYQLFPGNTLDKQTLIPALGTIQRNYDVGRIIVVADKGMTTNDNIWYTLSAKNGYVLSYSIRGADKAFKKFVLDEAGYKTTESGFKIKSRPYPREIMVTSRNGKRIKRVVHEKQVIFYSPKYAAKAKNERAAAIDKAMKLIANPGMYSRATSFGAAKYVKNLDFDKETGEVLQTKALLFDEEKLKQEEALDGYYAILTSEMDETDERIIEIYRGLWRIEEAFKVTKSDFDARPVYLSKKEHIDAHFLICFISLLIARIIENRLDRKHSVSAILESLSSACGTHIKANHYVFDYYDDVLADVGKEFDIPFDRKFLQLAEIKNILANVKK